MVSLKKLWSPVARRILRRREATRYAVAMLLPTVCLAALSCSTAEASTTSTGEPHRQVHRTERFAIEHDASPVWAAELGMQLESMARQFCEQIAPLAGADISRAPDQAGPLVWLCLTSVDRKDPDTGARLRAEYETRLHRVRLEWTGETGPGTPRPNVLATSSSAFEPDVRTVTGHDRRIPFARVSHEITHQLAFDCGLQQRGVMYPLWLSEGLATNFETDSETLRFLGPNPARQERLQSLLERQALMPLSALAVITETDGLSSSDRIDAYAQAWGLFRFLALQREHDLAAYFRELAAKPRGRRSQADLLEEISRSFGSLPELEQAWLAWVSRSTS